MKLTIKLMELHDENSFKIRSYQTALNTIERGDIDLTKLDQEALQKINGIGKSLAEVILNLIDTETFPYLEDLLGKTPRGLLEVLNLKGLGPKKVKALWEELNITSTHELMEACQAGQVAKLKGFGEKTQETIIQSLDFMASNLGKWHYAELDEVVQQLLMELQDRLGKENVALVGEFARNMEIIDKVEILVKTEDRKEVWRILGEIEILEQDTVKSSPFTWRGKILEPEVKVHFYASEPSKFISEKLIRTGSPSHLLLPTEEGKTLAEVFSLHAFGSEKEAYEKAGLAYILPELREGQFEHKWAKDQVMPKLLMDSDLKGILHNHSTYSDGKHSLKEMAEYAYELGYEYLGISDHSRTAIYAGGLEIEMVKKQQQEIEDLNKTMSPFVIFSGIESDILLDGSLDYPEEVLQSFDFVVASIHSSLGMNINKATSRLLNAISNPYTTILGHPTGRLLLRRDGYPIDHKTIIDACALHQVVIEINANPWRLDLDWRWVHYAMEKGVKLAINPDAHEKAGYAHMKYGVLVGRKGGLTKEMTLNALSAEELKNYFMQRKLEKNPK